MTETKMSFESAISRLEEIIRKLESGDAPLEASLAMFEEGTGLIRACGNMLDKAEQKVMALTKNENGELKLTPFDAASGDDK